MKQVLIGIFAHPDDETFGPAGTLLKLDADGYDIHLILLTDGEAGTNPDGATDLGAVRLQEWQAAGSQLGISTQTALHYPDGELDEVDTSVLGSTLEETLEQIVESYEEPVQVSLMTFEPQGVTGHRDHIAASQAAGRLYEHLRTHHSYMCGELWQFCLDRTQAPLDGTAYYESRAREDDFITRRVDVRPFLKQKYIAMDCHTSQAADAEAMKKLGDDLLATECFHVVS
jgi:LmbE family N-acetylglucosaminyl deacetylase